MNDHSFLEAFSPELTWGYNYKNRVEHFKSKHGNYDRGDYRLLVHPGDATELRRLIIGNLQEQKRLIQPTRQMLSLHRVRDSNGVYHRHISFITLARGW